MKRMNFILSPLTSMDLKEHPVHDFDTNSSEGNTHRDFLLLTGAAESDVHVKTKERC